MSAITAEVSEPALSQPVSPDAAMAQCFRAGRKLWLQFQPGLEPQRHLVKCTIRHSWLLLRSNLYPVYRGMELEQPYIKLFLISKTIFQQYQTHCLLHPSIPFSFLPTPAQDILLNSKGATASLLAQTPHKQDWQDAESRASLFVCPLLRCLLHL